MKQRGKERGMQQMGGCCDVLQVNAGPAVLQRKRFSSTALHYSSHFSILGLKNPWQNRHSEGKWSTKPLQRGDCLTLSRFLYQRYMGTKSGKLSLTTADSPTGKIPLQIPSLPPAMNSRWHFHFQAVVRPVLRGQNVQLPTSQCEGAEASVPLYLLSLLAGSEVLTPAVPFVSLSVVQSLFSLPWEPGRIPASVLLVAPVSAAPCRAGLGAVVPLLRVSSSSLHPQGVSPPLPKNTLSDIGSAPSFVSSSAGAAGR